MRVRALYIYIYAYLTKERERERDVCERFELSVLGARHVCEFEYEVSLETWIVFGQGPQGWISEDFSSLRNGTSEVPGNQRQYIWKNNWDSTSDHWEKWVYLSEHLPETMVWSSNREAFWERSNCSRGWHDISPEPLSHRTQYFLKQFLQHSFPSYPIFNPFSINSLSFYSYHFIHYIFILYIYIYFFVFMFIQFTHVYWNRWMSENGGTPNGSKWPFQYRNSTLINSGWNEVPYFPHPYTCMFH